VKRKSILSFTALAALLSACGGGSSDKPAPKSAAPAPTTVTPTRAAYDPKIDPAQFSSKVTNPYTPWKPGARWVYTGTKDGQPERVEVTVKKQTKTILGVRCVVVSDIVTTNSTLAEKTTDWYAQDKAGNVWYFGEDTAEYKNGVVTTTQGTWEAGVDNALPGIVMEAQPKKGDHFRQEYRPGVALDKATILDTNATVKVPKGTYQSAVITHDINPLDPTKLEHKWYAPGVGFVHAVLHQNSHVEISSLVK
jgi:hypothetical protein